MSKAKHLIGRFMQPRIPLVVLTILAVGFVLVPTASSFDDPVVTYDGGSPSRPVSLTNLSVNNIVYDVTITYNNNGATNPLRVGALPDADIDLAIGTMRSVLNVQGIESYYTQIFFQPNVDTLVTEPGIQMETGGSTFAPFPGSTVWSFGTVNTAFPAEDFEGPEYGFAQFSAVSEPSDSFTVTRGDHVSGGLVELADSDNLDLSLRRRTSDLESRTEFEFKSTSPTATPTTFEFTLEGSVFARSNVVQTIELLDYDLGTWELVDSSNAARSPAPDSVVTVAATGDLSRFVEAGTLSIEARIRYQSDNPRQRFASNTDQVIWTIE